MLFGLFVLKRCSADISSCCSGLLCDRLTLTSVSRPGLNWRLWPPVRWFFALINVGQWNETKSEASTKISKKCGGSLWSRFLCPNLTFFCWAVSGPGNGSHRRGCTEARFFMEQENKFFLKVGQRPNLTELSFFLSPELSLSSRVR